LEIRFHKRQILFLVVKTVKCKRGMSYHSNRERFCLQSFVRLGHYDRWTAWS